MKRVVLPVAVIGAVVAPAGAQCAATTDTQTLTLENGVRIVASETSAVFGCDAPTARAITITQGDLSCTGSPADVVTDPFGFGGGPRSAASETRGASAVTIQRTSRR